MYLQNQKLLIKSSLYKEVNCTDPSPSVKVPWVEGSNPAPGENGGEPTLQ
jgi:hypothetical protein